MLSIFFTLLVIAIVQGMRQQKNELPKPEEVLQLKRNQLKHHPDLTKAKLAWLENLPNRHSDHLLSQKRQQKNEEPKPEEVMQLKRTYLKPQTHRSEAKQAWLENLANKHCDHLLTQEKITVNDAKLAFLFIAELQERKALLVLKKFNKLLYRTWSEYVFTILRFLKDRTFHTPTIIQGLLHNLHFLAENYDYIVFEILDDLYFFETLKAFMKYFDKSSTIHLLCRKLCNRVLDNETCDYVKAYNRLLHFILRGHDLVEDKENQLLSALDFRNTIRPSMLNSQFPHRYPLTSLPYGTSRMPGLIHNVEASSANDRHLSNVMANPNMYPTSGFTNPQYAPHMNHPNYNIRTSPIRSSAFSSSPPHPSYMPQGSYPTKPEYQAIECLRKDRAKLRITENGFTNFELNLVHRALRSDVSELLIAGTPFLQEHFLKLFRSDERRFWDTLRIILMKKNDMMTKLCIEKMYDNLSVKESELIQFLRKFHDAFLSAAYLVLENVDRTFKYVIYHCLILMKKLMQDELHTAEYLEHQELKGWIMIFDKLSYNYKQDETMTKIIKDLKKYFVAGFEA